ncbi:hypothetical protein PtA15_10A647 [Puccinia triticina]|uniref:NADH-ubiquinone oxidoreductase 9.5 kDa subunit n=1 Tax=Puccinia triticina TaxID=208348 RepID=A0ABY7CWB6_9BASI|nr:uncharacterized protein PtA15_10A647 [Puccinia triticina]WAQ89223.1 hypothetical protein PtA15_10A647 [Puccinia triticina]WAR59277.1 hypothetical protein PtB15_10B619 [Puccinia triticina]
MSSASVLRLGRLQKARRYLQHQAHENPAIFWSVAIGVAGPVLLAAVPPIRRNYFGYVTPEPIPMSYPLPQRKRNPDLKGYDD